MSRRLRVDRDRFTIIPRGREPGDLGVRTAERRRDVRDRLGVAPTTPLVIGIGREVLPKGHTTLLRAVPALAGDVPGLRVLLAGQRGDRSDEIGRVIDELGIGGVVGRLGHRSDVPDLLAAADALAFPSSREGFPGTLVEALALECPIVASDIPAIRSILQRPGGRLLGTLVPVADSQALARSLAAVLDAPRDDAALSEGRDAFLGEFTTAAVAEQMAALYRSVIRPR
jgi:glycosyltransferase involved in cell wall biosynthesis